MGNPIMCKDCDESQVYKVGLEGVVLQPLKIISTPCGPVLHGLRKDYPLMPELPAGFGELYFSEVIPGCIKGWKKHLRQNQLFLVPYGKLRIVLYDDRPEAESHGQILELFLGRPDNYGLLKLPAGIWYSFTAADTNPALLCNCADMPHDPSESITLPLESPKIPYKW